MSRQFFDDMYAREESERRIKETSDPDYEMKRQAHNVETIKRMRAQRPWESSDLSREEYAMRLNAMFDKFSGKNNERKENPMKTFRPPYHVDFHSERGEVSIYVTDADDNEVWYGNDETVRELIEDGFIDAKGFIMGRNARPEVLERSVISYLRSVGVIPADEPRGRNDISVYEDNADLYSPEVRRMIDDNVRRGYENIEKIERMESEKRRLHSLRDHAERGDDPAAWYDENPRPRRRRNPGDVHIDIHSHNTRGSHVRAKNPLRKLWVIQWFNEDHPVEPMWMERTSFEGTHDEAMETLNILQKKQPHIEFRLAEDRLRSRRENPTREDVDGWVDHYRDSMEKRIDGVPEKAHYVVKIVTKDGQDAWLRVGKGTKFDTDPAKARVYRNGDKANEAATKVLNWLKKKHPAKAKNIQTISAEPKK